MKKSLLIFIAILLTQFSWAQSSLDSLRLVLPIGHTGINANGGYNTIDNALLSPNGKFLLTSGEISDFLLLHEVASGKVVQLLKTKKGKLEFACFSPDSKMLFTSYFQEEKKIIWDLNTGEIVDSISFSKEISLAMFNKNSSLIFISSVSEIDSKTNSKDASFIYDLKNKKKNHFTQDIVIAADFCDNDDLLIYNSRGYLEYFKKRKKYILMFRKFIEHDFFNFKYPQDVQVKYYGNNKQAAIYNKYDRILTRVSFRNLNVNSRKYRWFIDEDITIIGGKFFLDENICWHINNDISDTTSCNFQLTDLLNMDVIRKFQLERNSGIPETKKQYFNDLHLVDVDFYNNYKKLIVFTDKKNIIYDLDSERNKIFEYPYFGQNRPRSNDLIPSNSCNSIQISVRDIDLYNLNTGVRMYSQVPKVNVPFQKNKILISNYIIQVDEQLNSWAWSERNGEQIYFNEANVEAWGGDVGINQSKMTFFLASHAYKDIITYSLKDGKLVSKKNLNPTVWNMGFIKSHFVQYSASGNFQINNLYDDVKFDAVLTDLSLSNGNIFLNRMDSISEIIAYDFTKNDSFFLALNNFGFLRIVDVKSGNLRSVQRIIDEKFLDDIKVQFVKNGNLVIYNYKDSIKFYDPIENIFLKSFPYCNYTSKEQSVFCHKFRVSSDDNLVAFARSNYKVQLYCITDFTLVQEFEFNGSLIDFWCIDENFERIILVCSNMLVIYDVKTNNIISKFFLNSFYTDIDFGLSPNTLIISKRDGFVQVVEIYSGKSIFDRIQLGNNYLVKLPNSPYYMCSKDASKMLHYVTPSLKVIGFDQLDPVYNRPDIVLDSIGKYFGNEDRGMIEEYKKAWEKRIERLGLDKGKLSNGEIAVPNAEILNADQIENEVKDGSVIIQVKANDPKYTLRRYNVLVNEVPVYGSDGISISELNTKQWERTDTIALSIGNNKIQVSVMNELGLENFKYPTYVNYTPKNDIASKTYYVGIGVNEFKDTEHNLKYCVKDVQDLAQAFAKNQSKVDTLVFTNSEVTKENILALKSYLQKNTTVNDKVIISCSSHGLLDDSLNFYLATYDVDFAHPEKRGLAYEDLEGLLDGIPARQKLLLLDACNSGENERMFLQNNSSDQKAQAGMKGVNVEIVNEEIDTFHQMTEMFVNVRNNTGSVIIAASGGMQSAQEGRVVNGMKIENGAFTYSVLEYLAKEFNDQQKCTVNGMKNYVERRVEEITNAEQKPTSRQETMEVDWVVK